jgi:hypothetical protein
MEVGMERSYTSPLTPTPSSSRLVNPGADGALPHPQSQYQAHSTSYIPRPYLPDYAPNQPHITAQQSSYPASQQFYPGPSAYHHNPPLLHQPQPQRATNPNVTVQAGGSSSSPKAGDDSYAQSPSGSGVGGAQQSTVSQVRPQPQHQFRARPYPPASAGTLPVLVGQNQAQARVIYSDLLPNPRGLIPRSFHHERNPQPIASLSSNGNQVQVGQTPSKPELNPNSNATVRQLRSSNRSVQHDLPTLAPPPGISHLPSPSTSMSHNSIPPLSRGPSPTHSVEMLEDLISDLPPPIVPGGPSGFPYHGRTQMEMGDQPRREDGAELRSIPKRGNFLGRSTRRAPGLASPLVQPAFGLRDDSHGEEGASSRDISGDKPSDGVEGEENYDEPLNDTIGSGVIRAGGSHAKSGPVPSHSRRSEEGKEDKAEDDADPWLDSEGRNDQSVFHLASACDILSDYSHPPSRPPLLLCPYQLF